MMNSKCENSKAIVSYFGCDIFPKNKPVEMKKKKKSEIKNIEIRGAITKKKKVNIIRKLKIFHLN